MTNQTKRSQGKGGQGATRRNSPTSPTAIARRERDLRCVNLRRAGMAWQDIATQLGYSDPGHAYQRFMVIMKDYPREDVETARDVEADRYDQLQRAIWAKCLQGDTWAIDRALKLMDQRARLLGLNVPVRQTIEVLTESTVDAAIRELEAQIAVKATEVADAVHAADRGVAGEAAPSA